MKKILFAINTLNNGGAEEVLLTFLRYLDPEKYEIHLLVVFGEGIYSVSYTHLTLPTKAFTLNRFLNM